MLRIEASRDILQGRVLSDHSEASQGTWREDKIPMSHGNRQSEGTSLVSQGKRQEKGKLMLNLVSKRKSQGKPCEPSARAKASLSKSQDERIQVL